MSDYADGAEAMRKAILARFAELEDEWRVLRDTYDPREQYDDRMIATQEIEGYKTATGIVRGIILEDRRSMVCLTPRQAHGLADWMRKNGAADGDSIGGTAMKPGLALALRLLADDMDEAIAWLGDRYDYCTDKGKNKEARHCDTLARVQSELKRLSHEAERGQS